MCLFVSILKNKEDIGHQITIWLANYTTPIYFKWQFNVISSMRSLTYLNLTVFLFQ